MPVPWVALPAAMFITPAQGSAHFPALPNAGRVELARVSGAPRQAAQTTIRQVYGDLVVEAKTATFEREKVTFKEGVRATFGDEILTADTLTLYPKEERGEASGHVVLLDPAGNLSAEDLSFSWKDGAKGGSGRNVRLDMAGVLIQAAKAETIPGDPPTLMFTDVYGTSCSREKTPLYAIRSPKVIFHPGKDGV
ncbi:MAG: hypothetical protein QOJ65_2711, partial [Fimbriimonadaceae bacterium]|nr:hypothetical protein [Fimbriimonadaceae bacterium]